ncbi:MAG TPA: Ig-like domain-containing protein [Candidatus Saccharimonadales bacterium]|jgi:hypothetical protein
MNRALAKFNHLEKLMPLLVVGVLIAAGAVIYNFNARAATAGFSFTTSANSYKIGDTFEVAVYENSDTQCANVVQADFTYPANLLKYNAASASGSKFESVLSSDSGNGTVSLQQYTTRKECGSGGASTSGVSGNQLIARVSFTVINAGTAALNFSPNSTAISSSDNQTNVSPSSTGVSLTLTPQTSTTTPPVTSPPVTKPPSAPPKPAPRPVTAITPTTTGTAIPLNDNDVLQLEAPADVTPLPVQPDGINRIEYYLGGKLVATVKTAPYKYRLDTANMLNGRYNLTTKTYYANGQFKSVSQTVIVDNPFGFTQFKLIMKKFAWLIILLLLLIAAAVAAWIMHRGGKWNGHDDDPTDFTPGTHNVPSDGPVIQPSNVPLVSKPVAPKSSEAVSADIKKSPATQTVWQPRPLPSSPAKTVKPSEAHDLTIASPPKETAAVGKPEVSDDGANIIHPTTPTDTAR